VIGRFLTLKLSLIYIPEVCFSQKGSDMLATGCEDGVVRVFKISGHCDNNAVKLIGDKKKPWN